MTLCNNLEGPVDIALWEYTIDELAKQNLEGLTERSERLARSCSRVKPSS